MGCNSACAYCIVPAVRGREQSRRPGDIVAEVTRLAARRRPRDHAARAERELVGARPRARDPHGVRRAPARVRRGRGHRADPVHEPAPEGLPRAGRSRRWPSARASASTCICRRSRARRGSSRRCGARTTASATSRLVDRLRSAIPDLALGTDLIVGFPGETDDDFAETCQLVEEVGFDSAFTFIFSPRSGTEAADLPDQVPDDVKHDAARGARRSRAARRPPSETPPASAASRRCSSRGRAEPIPPCCAAALDATRRSSSPARVAAGELVDVLIEGATSTTLRGRVASLVAA